MALGFLLNVALGGFAGGIQWEEMESIPIVAALFFIAYAVTLPISFRLGVEKSRYIYIVVLALMGVAIFGWAKMMHALGVLESIDASYGAFVVMSLGVSILILLVSYRVSVRVVRNKEW